MNSWKLKKFSQFHHIVRSVTVKMKTYAHRTRENNAEHLNTRAV